MNTKIEEPRVRKGRPAKYKSPEQLEKKIREYMAQDPERPTKSGLALFLGFCDKDAMMNYTWRKVDSECFVGFIKKALTWIEGKHEARLYAPGCAASILWLKNHGWSDSRTVNVQGRVDVPASPERAAIEAEFAKIDPEAPLCDG